MTRFVHIAFIIVLVIAAWAWTRALPTVALGGPDSYDYAQMAQQIRAGEGMTTLQVFPRHVPWLKEHGYDVGGATPPPNLYRFPLVPLVSAAVQWAVPDAERATLVQSGLAFLFMLPVVYLLALRFLTPLLALSCALLVGAESMQWASAFDGGTEALATLLILAAVLLALSRGASAPKTLALGLLCGLAYLCRTQFFFLFPCAALAFLLAGEYRKRVRLLPWMALGTTLVLLPWLVRNFLVAGSPVFSFFNTRALLWFTRTETFDIELQLSAPVGLGAVLDRYGEVIGRNIVGNLWPNLLDPFALTSNGRHAVALIVVLLALLVLGFLRRFSMSERRCLFMTGVVVLVLANYVVVSLAGVLPRYLMPLDPLLIVAAVVGGQTLVEAILPAQWVRRATTLAGGLVVSVAAFLFVTRLLQPGGGVPVDAVDRDSYRQLATLPVAAGLVAADESHKVALYARRQAVRLPADPGDLLVLNRDHVPIRYVVFSSRMAGDEATSLYGEYQAFRQSAEFAALFEPLGKLPNGAELFGLRRRD